LDRRSNVHDSAQREKTKRREMIDPHAPAFPATVKVSDSFGTYYLNNVGGMDICTYIATQIMAGLSVNERTSEEDAKCSHLRALALIAELNKEQP
jgi:hypothetical protein